MAGLGVSIPADACGMIIRFEGRWALQPIVRWSKDPIASITATDGRPAFPYSEICLDANEFESLFRTVSGEQRINVEFFLAPEVCDFQAEYLGVIQKLLPTGFAWEAKTITESNLYKLLNVFAKIFSDVHCAILALADEFYPSTSTQLLDNWRNEAFSNSLQECLNSLDLSTQEQVLSIIAKLQASGSYRPEDFENVADVMGLEVQVSDDPSTFTMTFDFINPDVSAQALCDMTACSRLYDGADMNLMLAFICIMNKIAPAQSDKIFTINGTC